MAFQNSSHIDARGGIFYDVHGDQFTIGQIIRTHSDSPDLDQLLSPVNAAYNRSGRVPRCMDGTRKELIAKIVGWINSDHDRPICWLNGSAGSGKSAISQTVAELWESDHLAASFFFMRGAENRSTMAHFVPTLAHQLSVSVSATKPLIQQVLKMDRHISQKSLSYQFKKLMIEPMLAVVNSTLTPKTRTVIIVDALDECDDRDLMIEFIEIITYACLREPRFPFRIFLTSKVEEHLRKKLEAPATRSIIYPLNLQNFDASDDIHNFFRSRLSTIYEENHRHMREIPLPWPSNPDLDVLVEKAGGSFLRASEFINTIDDGTDVPHRKLAVILRASDRRRSPSILKAFGLAPRRPAQQISTAESSHVISPYSTSVVPSTLPKTLPIGADRNVIGGAQTGYLPGGHTSSTTPPHTLRSAVSNEQPPVSWAEDDTMKAATLESLIERLLADPPCVKEPEEYQFAFFTTYTAFTTADDVFRYLVRRFHDAEASPAQPRTHLRIKIITIMKYWVTNPCIKIDLDILARIKELAMSIQSSWKMKELAIELHSVAAERPISSPLSHGPSYPVTPPNKPQDLATALLILEGDKYTRILPADYISYLQHQPPKGNVEAAFQMNHRIINWVKYGVLNYDKLEDRIEVLKFLVFTAEESRKLRNFASMSAIVTALKSITIARLGLTCDGLPRDVQCMVEKMNNLLAPRYNHSEYMATLRGYNALPCIPLLAVHLSGMRTAFSKAKDVEVVDGNPNPMINFAKWTALHVCINDVFRHKSPDVSEYRKTNAGVVVYLEQQLGSISVGSTMDQTLENRSRELWKQEELGRQIGMPKLRAVGMR